MSQTKSAERVVRDIRRKTRRRFSAEEKIRIVMEGLRAEDSVAELCQREGISANLYYRWSKDYPLRWVSLQSAYPLLTCGQQPTSQRM